MSEQGIGPVVIDEFLWVRASALTKRVRKKGALAPEAATQHK
jgi:hypothetical protein